MSNLMQTACGAVAKNFGSGMIVASLSGEMRSASQVTSP